MRASVKMWQLFVAMAMTFVLAAVGTAIATIPDGNGVIHGCYKKAGNNKGMVRVIDTEATSSCPSGYAPIAWDTARTHRTLNLWRSSSFCDAVGSNGSGIGRVDGYSGCRVYDNADLTGTPVATADEVYVFTAIDRTMEVATFKFADGDINMMGGPLAPGLTNLSVVGGTGAYAGASGTLYGEWLDDAHTVYHYVIEFEV